MAVYGSLKAGLAALLFCASLSAQSLQFTRLPASTNLPDARFDGAIAYDSQSKSIYLFGGQTAAGVQNDVWVYSLADSAWTQVYPGGVLPPPRFGHTAFVDSARRRLVIFGGQAGTFFSDTWALDFGTRRWVQLSTDGAGPERRYGHSAIYDAKRDRMVISHGFTDKGRFDDTWAFDFTSNTWLDISPAAGRPLKRCLHHAGYDAKRDQMFLYAGCSSGYGPCPDEDLWSFNLATNQWTELTSSLRPPGRERYGMVFDAALDRLLVFGGGGTGPLLRDTWEFDPEALAWNAASVAGPVPEARDRHESVFDPDLGAMFFFGGQTASALTNELWMLAPMTGSAATPVFTSAGAGNAFSNANGAFAPGEIVSIYGTNLGPDTGVAPSFDATGVLPVQAAGVAVEFNGISAPIYFASAGQVNVQVPYEVAGASSANVLIHYQGAVGQGVMVGVQATHPGLYPGVLNQDLSLNSQANPAAAGSVIVLFATGQGVTNPASPTGAYPAQDAYPTPAATVMLKVGGKAAQLRFKGQAPGTAGVMQINAKLPDGVTSAAAATPITLTIGAQHSQDGVQVWIR